MLELPRKHEIALNLELINVCSPHIQTEMDETKKIDSSDHSIKINSLTSFKTVTVTCIALDFMLGYI